MTESKKTAKEAILERIGKLYLSGAEGNFEQEIRTLEWVRDLMEKEVAEVLSQPEEQCTQPDWADRFIAALKALKWPLAEPKKLDEESVQIFQAVHSPRWMKMIPVTGYPDVTLEVPHLLLLAQAHIQARGAGCADAPEVQTPATQQAKVLARLGALWAKRPELRLLQLIMNATEDQGAYFWSDERLLKQIARIFDHEPQEGK